ncbi:bifunctional phosphopantothenoylcysteine decarboxylase/phosphopantothenate--cysteine ligase CoaBC [Marinobacterium sp. D7]|uniref:bifunctional phosphopantothenoylcysteine decarboxylase/phosphopantothenate--cysteine ligase CoaBC n=1 Tax=Marinobacterium ramblicola TaxID=2849041 RepID=UPI001C2D258C|nr:bifunctional phosphopantothenoylcysteine decarboxylase/phosphopantothenate--cysteine ligase CoaBC [Marinobacterium ramblicola]MBV1787757.1 bifunctional phosphopantothenoylcysteine decarboxylase/phosphopantothenate--cysteine ligase CoaBC [Marinobacterium ramblicola]
MHRLTNRRILLGITGGIAAYKSAELTRLFKGAGADVRVVMTPAATEFITPLTLQALSGNPVHLQLLNPEAEAGMGHIELAKWADLILVAPASADFIARLAAGMGDDLLTTLCLASDAPICLAPAMNQAMWRDPRTQQNVDKLKASIGVKIFGPGVGEQACGDTGPGRMLEPVELAELASDQFETLALSGRTVYITAGPTREALDPVRYISNHSSGKMGYALAEAARDAGARVRLISGPVSIAVPDRVQCVQVESAQQMLNASLEGLAECDLFIAAAAVADYRPVSVAEHKIKKGSEEIMELHLVKNPDIVATVASSENRPFTVGFAAETRDVVAYAQDKLARKRLDLIVANDVSAPGIGFNSDENAVTLVGPDSVETLPQTHKQQLARQLINRIARHLNEQTKTTG